MNLLNKYPNLKIIQELAKRRKVSVYLVGGFLRDYLLRNQKMDFDFAVERDALKLARQFSNKIKGAYVLLDEEHGCARVVKKNKGMIETYDFADYRAKSIKGDLSHRDFTINTLSVHLNPLELSTEIDQVLLDLKKGLKDIKAKTIKMTSVKAFKEDPLRVLRAYSLSAALDFKIEQKTLAQIKKDKDLLIDVSSERVRDELFKILESSAAAKTLKAMDKIGLLEKVIPQVHIMYHCTQGAYHHLDVWPHSLETAVTMEKLFDEIQSENIDQYLSENIGGNRSRRALMKLAALLHDIGKPETKKKENGRVSFHGHEHAGRNIVRHIARMLKLSTHERYALEDMVLWHLRPGYLSNFKNPTEKSIYRYFRDTKNESVSILLLSLADQRATRGPLTTSQDQAHHEKICLELVARYFDKLKEKPFVRLINGNDLVKTLKLKPSPLFGKILTEVAEKQNLGKIRTRSEAISLARKLSLKK